MSSIKYTEESLDQMMAAPNEKELSSAIMTELRYLTTQYRNSRQREYLLKQTAWNIIRQCREEGFKPTDTIEEVPF